MGLTGHGRDSRRHGEGEHVRSTQRQVQSELLLRSDLDEQ
jgi:hypothetical protein